MGATIATMLIAFRSNPIPRKEVVSDVAVPVRDHSWMRFGGPIREYCCCKRVVCPVEETE